MWTDLIQQRFHEFRLDRNNSPRSKTPQINSMCSSSGVVRLVLERLLMLRLGD
jgi:hypothetical protein